MLWPRVVLPQVTVRCDGSWDYDIRQRHHLEPGDENLKHLMWKECHDVLQTAYSTAEVLRMYPNADKAWDCLSTCFMLHIYAIKDLSELNPGPTSVRPVQSEEVRLPEHVIRSGIPENSSTDSDDCLWMAPAPINGCSSHRG